QKFILAILLASVLLSCTACRKNQENLETIPETTAITETIPITIETIDPTESPLQLEMQEALQNAIDEEKRQAIQDVQLETEKILQYRNPNKNFKKENFQNLVIDNYNSPSISNYRGSNVYKYFFNAKSMSGKNLLQIKKIASQFANIAIDINHINSDAQTLEDSKYLLYHSDSLYLKLQNTGECLFYRPDMIQEFTGEEISDNWNPLAHSTILEVEKDFKKRGEDIFINYYEEQVFDEEENRWHFYAKKFYLNEEETSFCEIEPIINTYLVQAQENGSLSSLYKIAGIQNYEVLEFANGIQAFYITVELTLKDSGIMINNTQKSAFLNEEQQIRPQEIKVLMFNPDSIAYMELPATFAQEPDSKETLASVYCTTNKAWTILSDYLSQDYVYHINRFSIVYDTLFLYQDNQYVGVVQAPMYHFEIDNPDNSIPYQTIYADIALDTQQLYISYS
ncbi:MAG: hypothetical protein K2G88_01030, partial [Oscillospiraceae bacterium]|nr:hypothetical protein [Oscillospiraceae bacterium]